MRCTWTFLHGYKRNEALGDIAVVVMVVLSGNDVKIAHGLEQACHLPHANLTGHTFPVRFRAAIWTVVKMQAALALAVGGGGGGGRGGDSADVPRTPSARSSSTPKAPDGTAQVPSLIFLLPSDGKAC
jgi:hypothetical protein